MKKVLCYLFASVIAVSTIQPVYAKEPSVVSESTLAPIDANINARLSLTTPDLSNAKKQKLVGDESDISNYTFYKAEDTKLAKQLLHIDNSEEIAKLEEQGCIITEDNIYILEENASPAVTKPTTRIVINELKANKPAKQIGDSKYGMSHWLDVSFGLLLDECGKYVSTAAAILGINASDFLPEWQSGDMLEKSESRVRLEKWVQVKSNDGKYYNAGRAIKDDITVYIDLRTFKRVNGKLQAVRESNDKLYVSSTKNYNNNTKLIDLTIANATVGDLVVSLYDDPWE